jgi:succinate-acetate transporter protein
MGGIAMILAGMWEYRKSYTISATIFTAYGGFLAALGIIFMPVIAAALTGGVLDATLGLAFLCWTIFTGVLFLGTLRMYQKMWTAKAVCRKTSGHAAFRWVAVEA